jgi:hypothetical protein
MSLALALVIVVPAFVRPVAAVVGVAYAGATLALWVHRLTLSMHVMPNDDRSVRPPQPAVEVSRSLISQRRRRAPSS